MSRFESFPVELRILILQSVPDFATLRSLVHACPAYHHAYLTGNKEQILSGVIERQHIRGTELDALGAVLSLEYTSGLQDQEDETIAFLDRYRHARGARRWADLIIPHRYDYSKLG